MILIEIPIIYNRSSLRVSPKKIEDVLSELDKDPILDEAVGLDEVDHKYDDEEDEDDDDIDSDDEFDKRWYGN